MPATSDRHVGPESDDRRRGVRPSPVDKPTGSGSIVATRTSRSRESADMAGPERPNVDPRAQATRVVRALARTYPDAVCALEHRDPYELVVATILSAQCTD